jgi:hypothetical protein
MRLWLMIISHQNLNPTNKQLKKDTILSRPTKPCPPTKHLPRRLTAHTSLPSSDWRTQTYQKAPLQTDNFEIILEAPPKEAYGTTDNKRRKRRDFERFYNDEMNFVQDKFIYIAFEQAKKENEEVERYKRIRQSMHLMSDGSKKILHNRYKSSIANDYDGGQMNRIFNTPVHERLFIDHQNRKKKLEELKVLNQDVYPEGSFANRSSSRKGLIDFEELSTSKGNLNSYRSVKNLNSNRSQKRQKINKSLKKTIANQTEAKDYRYMLASRGNRSNLPISVQIPSNVSTKLYEDAMRRRSQKLESLQKLKKREKSSTVCPNSTSKKYLVRRFNQDFFTALKSQGFQTGSINYFTTGEVLKDMGFMDSGESNEERILFVDFWRVLRGDENDGVMDKNLKILLGAIEGFKFEITKKENIPKRHVLEITEKVSATKGTPSTNRKNHSNSASKSKGKRSPKLNSQYEFDNDGILQLSRQDIKKIQKYFFVFAMNRSKFLSNKFHKKHAEVLVKETSLSHKPNIDTKSKKIIRDLHEKLNENQIPHYEFLLFKGREYERKIQESRTDAEEKANDHCTFFPDTSITSSFYVKNKDKRLDGSISKSRISR